MTREEMREKVKELIASGCGCDRMCIHTKDYCGCQNDADAAIALARNEALEEAAKVAEHSMATSYAWNDACHEIAAAIRALKEDKP